MLLLIADDDDDPATLDLLSPRLDPHNLSVAIIKDTSTPHMSLNTISGMPASEKFCLYSHIAHSLVTVLVGGCSTHNFVQTRVAKFLGLHCTPTSPLLVVVGNGSVPHCEMLCPQVTFNIQGTHFTLDFHVLPINGADLVLDI